MPIESAITSAVWGTHAAAVQRTNGHSECAAIGSSLWSTITTSQYAAICPAYKWSIDSSDDATLKTTVYTAVKLPIGTAIGVAKCTADAATNKSALYAAEFATYPKPVDSAFFTALKAAFNAA